MDEKGFTVASPEQQTQIIALIEQGLSSPEIAQRVGVGIMVVAGYKAALARASKAESEEVVAAVETTFRLERDLQDALRRNIEQLESGLKIADGGKEQKVASGFIDITAQDQQGQVVVIELKAGTADRETIGQILGYMGDLSIKEKPVRGIIVAREFAIAAISALGAVTDLQLKKYSYKFSFESIDRATTDPEVIQPGVTPEPTAVA
jgi:RecB family endonuclease NucS